MKISFPKKVALFIISCFLCLPLVGCWKSDLSGSTYVEPEITVDYLITEFADQITRDGAEKMFGIIESAYDNKDGTYTLTVSGKQFVNDSSQPNGFYIADRNIDYELKLSKDARTVIFPTSDLEDGQFFVYGSEFIQAFNSDFSGLTKESLGNENTYYFYFYLIYDSVELIIQQYIP
jgi:hypothetical protein